MTEASLEQNMTAARQEHVVPGREIHLDDMRGYRYCEVGLIAGTSQGNAVANIWNTTGACDPTPEQWDELDAVAVAADNGAMRAWLDPVQRCLFDRLDVWEAGENRAFGNITGTWTGVAGAAARTPDRVRGSYDPGYMYRNVTFTFNRGSQVHLLDAPDGEVFVMHSFTQDDDAAPSEDNLPHLGGRLDLPAGWGFRSEILDEDLQVSTATHNHLAHVMQDDLHNVYLGSDVGRAFTTFCREENARW